MLEREKDIIELSNKIEDLKKLAREKKAFFCGN
jgi:hypothetical protein